MSSGWYCLSSLITGLTFWNFRSASLKITGTELGNRSWRVLGELELQEHWPSYSQVGFEVEESVQPSSSSVFSCRQE